MTNRTQTEVATMKKEGYAARILSAITAIGSDIDGGRISPGHRAELRRGWGTGPGPAFWRLSMERLEPLGLVETPEQERRWSTIVAGLAETKGLPRRGISFGRAAQQAGVAELRLLRLLRSDDETLNDALRGLVVQIAQAGYGFDWKQPAFLVLARAPEMVTSSRREIARDYYRSVAKDREAGTALNQ